MPSSASSAADEAPFRLSGVTTVYTGKSAAVLRHALAQRSAPPSAEALVYAASLRSPSFKGYQIRPIELGLAVCRLGGVVEVIRSRRWQAVRKALKLPHSTSSGATLTRIWHFLFVEGPAMQQVLKESVLFSPGALREAKDANEDMRKAMAKAQKDIAARQDARARGPKKSHTKRKRDVADREDEAVDQRFAQAAASAATSTLLPRTSELGRAQLKHKPKPVTYVGPTPSTIGGVTTINVGIGLFRALDASTLPEMWHSAAIGPVGIDGGIDGDCDFLLPPKREAGKKKVRKKKKAKATKDGGSRRKRKAWTKEEDATLKAIVMPKMSGSPKSMSRAINIKGTWGEIAASIPGRDGKQCRERFLNHLHPRITKSAWTDAEDTMIMEFIAANGTAWTELSSVMGNRSANAIKNRFHGALKRKMRKK